MRSIAALAAALVLAASAATSAARPAAAIDVGQWHQNPATGHFYAWLSYLPWDQAEAFAISVGGHLATVNDAAEESWLAATFPGENLWIGFNDVAEEDTFVWASGEPAGYTNWCPGEPDDWQDVGGEDYVAMNGAGGDVTGCWIDADGGAFEGIVETVRRPQGAVGSAPAGVNRFYGNFDLIDSGTGAVVGHVIASFTEPSDQQLVPGSVAVTWDADSHNGIRESHAQIIEAWFWDSVSVDNGYEQLARVVGVLCDYAAAQAGSCQSFAMAFANPAAPGAANAVGFSQPGSTACCDGPWYTVGKGSFHLQYVTDTTTP